MQSQDSNIKQIEKEIILALQEELFYYQAVTDLLSKQRDVVRNDSLDKLDQLFEQMRKEEGRIRCSSDNIQDLSGLFYKSGIIPCLEISKLMNQIEKTIRANLALLNEITKLVTFKRDKIRIELKNLANFKQLSNYGRKATPLPQFLDKRN